MRKFKDRKDKVYFVNPYYFRPYSNNFLRIGSLSYKYSNSSGMFKTIIGDDELLYESNCLDFGLSNMFCAEVVEAFTKMSIISEQPFDHEIQISIKTKENNTIYINDHVIHISYDGGDVTVSKDGIKLSEQFNLRQAYLYIVNKSVDQLEDFWVTKNKGISYVN